MIQSVQMCLFSQKIGVIDLCQKLVVYEDVYSWGVDRKNEKHFRKPSHCVHLVQREVCVGGRAVGFRVNY